MARIFIVAFGLLLAAGTAAGAKVSSEAIAGVQKALGEIGCKVEDEDIVAKGTDFKVEDVECKDGQYDMTLGKDFKITNKKKED